MTIYVLGTMYEISYVGEIKGGHSGRTDFVNKKIEILNDPSQDLESITRHEIMHAFFYESGLLEYSNDELLVDFLAIQYKKIKELMDKVTL